MTSRSTAPVRAFVVYLPALASLAVTAIMVLAAQFVGFLHPQVTLEAGQFTSMAPTSNTALAADLSGRLHWSLAHATWWLVQAATLFGLVRLLGEDTARCGGRGQRLWRVGIFGAVLMGVLMLAAGALGVQFAGPLVAALQALPQATGGAVLAAGAVWVNAGSAATVFLLSFGFSAVVLRWRSTDDGGVSERFDQLLWIGAVFLALTTLEIALGYRWATLLLGNQPGEALALAVAGAQARVIGGVSSLSLGAIAVAATVGIGGHLGAASVTHWFARALAVSVPVLVALTVARGS